MKPRHRRTRSHTGETLENDALEDGYLTIGRSGRNAKEAWGTIRNLFDKKKSKGTGWDVYNATSIGDDKLLAKLLDRPTAAEDVNFAKPTSKNTPLHKAAKYGYSVCAFLLIFADCDVNPLNKEGEVSKQSGIVVAANLLISFFC